MPATRVRILLSDLDDTYGETWVLSAKGHLTQIMRRDALALARKHLLEVGTIGNATDCLARVRAQAMEMQNCRPPVDNPEFHLQLQLRMFAFIQWLLDSPTDENRNALEAMAEELRCPEILNILAGKPIE